MKKLFMVVAVLSAATLALSADIYVKTVTTYQVASASQEISAPEQTRIAEQWISGKKIAMVNDPITVIVDIARNSAILVTPVSKTYVETALPIDMIKLLPAEIANMASAFQYTATVKPSGETKKIREWNCSGYDVAVSRSNGTSFAMKIWATTDVPFDLTDYQEMMGAVQKAQMFLSEATVKEFAKIKGIQVATEATMEYNEIQTRIMMETVEISQKNAPPGIFEIPAGFTKKATLSLGDLRRH